MTQQELLESAVRKLGPERAQQALRAFAPSHDSGRLDGSAWEGCALALAYGGRGELHAAIRDDVRANGYEWSPKRKAAARRLGLSFDELCAVTSAYDVGCGYPIHRTLRSLLEAEAAKISVRTSIQQRPSSEVTR